MNGSSAASVTELVAGIVAGMRGSESVELLVCPPFPYLASCRRADRWRFRVALGAQTLSEHESHGAFTGETAGSHA